MLTQEQLKSVLRYDPELGVFIWLAPRTSGVKPGDEAGSLRGDRGRKKSSWRIRVFGRVYSRHRLAWFYMTGEWPEEIDHRDLDPTNDRWTNLRIATRSQNLANRRNTLAPGLLSRV